MSVTVLQPNFDFVAFPRHGEHLELALLSQLGSKPIVNPALTSYFGANAAAVQYLSIKQPDNKAYYQTNIAGVPKLFYMFGLPNGRGSTEIYEEPQFMLAVECNVTRDSQTQYTVRPQTIHAGAQASFVMGVSYECCEADAENPAMTVLGFNHVMAEKGFRRASSTSGLRTEIQDIWKNISINFVRDEMGLQNLHHLSRDIAGTCQHATNPQHALIHNRLRMG